MALDRKFEISLYHEHFPAAWEKCTRFPESTLLFSVSYVRINGETSCFLSFIILCSFAVFEQTSA